LDKYDCFTVGETAMVDLDDAKLLCDSARRELDMLFYFDHLEVDRRVARFVPKKFEANKLLAVIDKWQRGLEWNAVYLENHDQPRIVSHYGDDGNYWLMSAKLLATLEFTLRGTPFVYQGQEIGMTNFDFTSLEQVQDTESHSIDALMRRFRLPTWLRWGLLRVSSRDNARTPMQWSALKGAGFTTGVPWLTLNANHTRINREAQQGERDSVLNYYKRMIALRAGSNTLKYGDFTPLYATEKVIAYSRALGNEKYTVALNFSKKPSPIRDVTGGVVISNTDRTEMTDTLSPWEAVVVKDRLIGE
jgi:oligo-1,6-glucosidase